LVENPPLVVGSFNRKSCSFLIEAYSSSAKKEYRMAQSAALLSLPARGRTEEADAAKGTTHLLQQSQEDLYLVKRVERAPRATGYGPLRGIEVTVLGRLIILGARVPSYSLKQVAQTTALAIAAARQIRNDLDVGPPVSFRQACKA
jgi:hypothetical protein